MNESACLTNQRLRPTSLINWLEFTEDKNRELKNERKHKIYERKTERERENRTNNDDISHSLYFSRTAV